jgi:hypothetical protein
MKVSTQSIVKGGGREGGNQTTGNIDYNNEQNFKTRRQQTIITIVNVTIDRAFWRGANSVELQSGGARF